MANTKDRITQDLKTAMLAGDKPLVSILRGLKSAILYEEVSGGSRDAGLSEDKVLQVLTKEAKKRQDSAELFLQGGDKERAAQELSEKAVIDAYLPEKISEEKLVAIVQKHVAEAEDKNMGKIISGVKSEVGLAAEGALIARLVKEQLQA